jgi:hypothetical protein
MKRSVLGNHPTRQDKMFTLLFTTTTKNLVVTGKTFPIKEQLKALGGIWNSPRWILPLNADSPLTRANLVESCRRALIEEKESKVAAEKARIAYLASPEAVKDALKAKAAGDYSYHWICCEDCVVIDWARQHTSCQSCGYDNGMWKETFFVRGSLRTGD